MSIPTQRAPFVTSYFQGSTARLRPLLSGQGSLPGGGPAPPCGAPAAAVGRHTAGKQTSPLGDQKPDPADGEMSFQS